MPLRNASFGCGRLFQVTIQGLEIMRFLMIVVAALASTSAFAIDQRAALWVSDLQRVEEMIAASIETGDAEQLKRQVYAAHRLTGRAQSELAQAPRFDCVSASGALANIGGDLQMASPANGLVNARADFKIYLEHVARCEKQVGVKGVRRLRF